MLEHFMYYFRADLTVQSTGNFYKDLISQLGGYTFGKGLIRFFTYDSIPDWMERVREAFPWVRQKYRLFAFDWLGIIYGISKDWKGKETLLVFDITDDDCICTDVSPLDWLDRYIPWKPDEFLRLDLYREWFQRTNQPLKFQDCVSLKIPLDYGGELELDNMELCDMDVYWAVFTAFRNAKQGEKNRRKHGPM